MKTVWIPNSLSEDRVNDIKRSYESSSVTRGRLVEILKKKIEGGFLLTKEDYDLPNWEYKQADGVGYRRALEEVISILGE